MEYVSVVTEIDDVNNPIVGVNGWVQSVTGGFQPCSDEFLMSKSIA